MKLDDLKKKLSPKRRKIAQAIGEGASEKELLKIIDEIFPELDGDEVTAKEMLDYIAEVPEVQEYSFSLGQTLKVEQELFKTATSKDLTPVKQKAIDSYLDRVKGKAQAKLEIAGEVDLKTVINIIKPKE